MFRYHDWRGRRVEFTSEGEEWADTELFIRPALGSFQCAVFVAATVGMKKRCGELAGFFSMYGTSPLYACFDHASDDRWKPLPDVARIRR